MNKIGIFDTSIYSDNLGDEIIMRSVNSVLREIFPNADFARIPTHIYPSKDEIKIAQKSHKNFVGGTNLLCANQIFRPQWKFSPLEVFAIKNKPILLGCGWKFYQRKTDILSKIYWQNLLNRNYLHSVRDSYTLGKLHEMGIRNAINTS